MASRKATYWTTPEGLALLEGYARGGEGDDEVARRLGVTKRTLRSWRQRHPEIDNVMRRAGPIADFEVEKALLEKAKGGDTTAMLFWLKNRRPDRWKDRPAEGSAMTVRVIDDVPAKG